MLGPFCRPHDLHLSRLIQYYYTTDTHFADFQKQAQTPRGGGVLWGSNIPLGSMFCLLLFVSCSLACQRGTRLPLYPVSGKLTQPFLRKKEKKKSVNILRKKKKKCNFFRNKKGFPPPPSAQRIFFFFFFFSFFSSSSFPLVRYHDLQHTSINHPSYVRHCSEGCRTMQT